MALPGVSIQLQNGLLGQVGGSADGVAALICSSDPPGNLTLGVPVLITSSAQAIDQYGISPGSNAYRHIVQFFAEAGEGAELYIMLVPRTTTMVDMCNKNLPYAATLLQYGAGRIRLLAVAKDPEPSYTPVTTSGIDQDVLDALANADELARQFQNNYQPVRILLEAGNFTGNIADLPNLHTMAYNHVGLVLGTDSPDGRGCVGLAIGRAARIPVHRNIGRVKDGPLAGITAAFLGNKSVDRELNMGDLGIVHDKGYIFMRTYTGKQGYYFNDDPMAAQLSDDYNSLARGRVIDKAMLISYQTYVDELLDDVQVDSSGKISAAVIKYLQSRISQAINTAMAGEISNFSVFIDPDQNIISTGKLQIVERIQPVGYNKYIVIQLGFSNPAAG
jgi:hypothetical protein